MHTHVHPHVHGMCILMCTACARHVYTGTPLDAPSLGAACMVGGGVALYARPISGGGGGGGGGGGAQAVAPAAEDEGTELLPKEHATRRQSACN